MIRVREILVSVSAVVVVLMIAPFSTQASLAQTPSPTWGFVENNGTKLFYEVAGSGSPVVLVHGGWLNSEQWDEQFALLSRTHRVVRYDFRGAGRSPLGDSAYSHAEDLAAIFKALNIDRADLVGLSQGAQISIDFVLAYPDKVRSMMIGGSPLSGFDPGPEFLAGMRGVVSAGASDDPQLTYDRIWGFAPFRVASTMPEVKHRLDDMIVHQNSWAANRAGAPHSKPYSAPPATRLSEIRKPVLIVVGEGDMDAFRREADFVSKHIAGARLVQVPGAGHFVNLEQPAKYNDILLSWLKHVEATTH
jgi:pimeloyl-ACP methyl ester carboxylesterase